MYRQVVDRLLKSGDPSIRYRARVHILKENPHSPAIVSLQEEIRRSERAQRLLSGKAAGGELEPANNPYHKWFGAHWVLVHLAEIGYPAGDRTLLPLRDQVYKCWLAPNMQRLVECKDASQVYRIDGVPVLQGRAQRCASQQANALFSTLKLGIADEQVETLVTLLLRWQWPDGGWNCDKKPDAHVSSFTESHIPLRALALYRQKAKQDATLTRAFERVAEVFLSRHLFKKLGDGQIMHPEFGKLHYPCYWHYDLLFGLKIMAEAGFLHDQRCADALDILEQKALPTGGWTADGRAYYQESQGDESPQLNKDKVSWGRQKGSPFNEWVTTDALFVLTEARRVQL